VLAATAGLLILEYSSAVAQERAAGPTAGAAAPAGNVDNGKKLFVSAGCALCHNGEGQGGGPGPRLAPNPNMLAFKVFVQRAREPVNAMPPYTAKVLSDQQLADIYAFLQTIPRPPDVSTIPLLR
jgi:mono/diheme cytochrome c family protein